MIRRRLLTATLTVAVGAMLAVGLTACDFYVPQGTKTMVETSDGVSGTTGKVHVGNAVLVSGDGGQLSNLVMTLSNQDFVDHEVTIDQGAGEGISRTINVPAGESVQVGTPGDQIELFVTVDSPPGSLHALTFTATDGSPLHLRVPVLDSSLPPYTNLGPPDNVGITADQSSK